MFFIDKIWDVLTSRFVDKKIQSPPVVKESNEEVMSNRETEQKSDFCSGCLITAKVCSGAVVMLSPKHYASGTPFSSKML